MFELMDRNIAPRDKIPIELSKFGITGIPIMCIAQGKKNFF